MDYAQWIRYFKLTVAVDGSNTAALDLSDYRVRFSISQRVVGKPTTADITIYNVSQSTVDQIQFPTNQEVAHKKLKVIIEAGYQNEHSIIFQGDLWWKSVGRESETDTFMRLIAATGDSAHQYAVVNASIPAGATQEQVFTVIAQSMAEKGVESTGIPQELASTTKLPRGKVIYGMSAKAMQGLADTNNFLWGYGTNGLIAIPKTPSYDAQSDVIVLTSKTGLIGRPKMTVNGVEFQCLLNPRIDVGSFVQIDNKSIQRDAYDTSGLPNIDKNNATLDVRISEDGLYRVISREVVGDTRGNEWYLNLIADGVNAAVTTRTPTILNSYVNM